MNIKKQILSSDGVAYLGLAKNKFKQLESVRLKHKLSVLSKTIAAGDTLIYLYSSEYNNLIRISGGGSYDFVANWTNKIVGIDSEKLNSKVVFKSGSLSGFLAQLNTASVGLEGFLYKKTNKSLSKKYSIPYSSITTNYITKDAIPVVGFGIILSGNTLLATDNESVTAFATTTMDSLGLIPTKNQAGLVHYRNNNWNGLGGPELWAIPVSDPNNATYSWSWYPSIWHSQAHDPTDLQGGDGLESGIYYGKIPYQPDSSEFIRSSKRIEVEFSSLLLDYAAQGIGYVEILKKLEGTYNNDNELVDVEPNVLFIYDEVFYPSRGSDNLLLKIIGGEEYRYAYNMYGLKSPIYSEDITDFGPDVKTIFWSFNFPKPEVALDEFSFLDQNDYYYGLVIYNLDGKYKIIRFHVMEILGIKSVSNEPIDSGIGFKSASIRDDGIKIAIIKETEIAFFKLGELSKQTKKKIKKIKTTPISGEFLPTEKTGLDIGYYDIEDIGNPLLSSFMAGVSYEYPLNNSIMMGEWKIWVEENAGKYLGFGEILQDDCFKSKITAIRPIDTSNLDREHSVYANGEEYVSSNFDGLRDIIPYGFAGINNRRWIEVLAATWDYESHLFKTANIEAGTNTKIETIEFTPDFIHWFGPNPITAYPYEIHKPDNFTEPVEWGNTIELEVNSYKYESPDFDQVDCDCNVEVSCTDSCGHEQTRVIQWPYMDNDKIYEISSNPSYPSSDNFLPVDEALWGNSGSLFSVSVPCSKIEQFEWQVSNNTGFRCYNENCSTIEITSRPVVCDFGTTFVSVTANSSCGGSGQKDYPVFVSELVVGGEEDVAVGNSYGGSGGVPPYVMSFSNGSIDRDTGKILSIDNCGEPGSVATGIVTVRDSCGNTATMEVRLPDGHWTAHPEYDCIYNDLSHQISSFILDCTGFNPYYPNVYYQYPSGRFLVTETATIFYDSDERCGTNIDHFPDIDGGARTGKADLICADNWRTTNGDQIYFLRIYSITYYLWEC